jgi:NO-binding membrane sensor protein with MHYT domain
VAEIHHFAHGWLNPALAYVMAVLGCLVGLLHASKARVRPGWRRVRMLIYATVAIGGTGIWQMHFVAMLGFTVPDSVVRYDPRLLTLSLGIAIVVVGCGLFTAGFGHLRGARLHLAGVLIGLGIAGMHYTGMAAVRLGGSITYEPGRFVASVLVAIVAATAALWFVTVLRGLTATVLAALVMGAAISGMHYTAMSAVQVRLGLHHPPIAGVDPMMLLTPIVLLSGAALSMLAFFTFGSSTVRDMRLIYEPSGELSEPIEPWLIAEVLARTSRPATALPAGSTTDGPRSHRAGKARIDRSLRNNVVWGGTPVWGGRAGVAIASTRPTPPRPVSAPAPTTVARATAPVPRVGDQRGPIRRAMMAITPARYPPNDPGWDCPGVIGARAPEYHGNRRT